MNFSFKIWNAQPKLTVPFRSIKFCLCALAILLSLQSSCEKPADFISLHDVLSAGEITVITRNNSHCYYLYRDQAMGFEHDLAQAFAAHLGVKLKVKIADKWEGMIPELIEGGAAFIAASLTITESRKQQVEFSKGYLSIRQHIIGNRKNGGIKKIEDLAGKTVHVRKGTSYQERLEGLKKQGALLNIQLHEDTPTEEFIQQVADGTIDVTIADSNIAFRNRRYYPQVVVGVPISPVEQLGWAVHPKADKLLEKINAFFKKIKTNGEFQRIYNQYYAHIDIFDYVDLRSFHRRIRTRLPRYQVIIEEAAKKYHFDWRLIAAQIYQESHFNPRARSHAGAYGLMQLTRSTARSLGVDNVLNSKQNIMAGVRHLRNLYQHFDQAKGSDRLFIALAAYNVGQGHIMDARNLARKMDLHPNTWGSLSKTLPLLRYHKYYKDAVYGYCRGQEPLEYVKQIMIYYDILKHQGIEYRTDVLLPEKRLKLSSDKGVGALFPSDGGFRAVSGKYGDIVSQRKQSVFYTCNQGVVVSAGKIGSSD